jgi:hypothetical protein
VQSRRGTGVESDLIPKRDASERAGIRERSDQHLCRSEAISWAWEDLNLRPHPQVKIPARGGKLPGTYQGRRGPRPLRGAVNGQGWSCAAHLHPSGVAAGHEPLISYRGLSAVRTGVSPGRRRASGAKLCVLATSFQAVQEATLLPHLRASRSREHLASGENPARLVRDHGGVDPR